MSHFDSCQLTLIWLANITLNDCQPTDSLALLTTVIIVNEEDSDDYDDDDDDDDNDDDDHYSNDNWLI